MMLKGVHPYLYRAVYVFTVVALFVVAAASFSYVYMNAAKDRQIAAQRAMKIWKHRVDSSRLSNSIVDTYETTYLNLVNNAVIGSEDRLSWYEVIQNTSEDRGMPSVRYSVSSQTRYDSHELSKQFRQLELYQSKMTMDVRMSHEGDLFALLNNLQQQAKGLFVVNKCDIERISSGEELGDTNNMKAYCELSWYTIRAQKRKG